MHWLKMMMACPGLEGISIGHQFQSDFSMMKLFALALSATTVFAGICNDKRPDCTNWARDNECMGDNAVPSHSSHRLRCQVTGHPLNCLASCRQKFMAIECPLSCGICTHQCNDTETSCGAWATAGECEANPDSMLRLCPTSCGLCTPECKDIDKECPGWGAAGECNTNPEFMIRTCPVTCEACKATCKDIQPDCPGWTADGECFKNPGFMCVTRPRARRPIPVQPARGVCSHL